MGRARASCAGGLFLAQEAILWLEEWDQSAFEGFLDEERRLTYVMRRTVMRLLINGLT